MHDLLFGDVPLSAWAPSDQAAALVEPWRSFAAARDALGRGDRDAAIATLRGIATSAGLESRQIIEAWTALRALGVVPGPTEAKHVYGVILEVPVDRGLDTLAAYEDGTARYINHSGRTIVWEADDRRIAGLITDLLKVGQAVANRIGPWTEPRRGIPADGSVRINMLTPSGLHFGEGPFDVLARDPMGGPVIAAGTALMQALISYDQKGG